MSRSMSTPPDGPRPPFALAGTMLRVMITEHTDSGRLVRGRQLYESGAVEDLSTQHGTLTAEVQGGEPTPYTVHWRVTALSADAERRRRSLPEGDPGRASALVPRSDHVRSSCTCADAITTIGGAACKHAVAVMLLFADAIAVDATSLARWRGLALDATDPVTDDDPALSHIPTPETAEGTALSAPESGTSGFVDPLGDWLSWPGDDRPARVDIHPLDPPRPDDDDVAGVVLADALAWMNEVAPW
jgi:hypothetical protein